jgi:hypothetical protein
MSKNHEIGNKIEMQISILFANLMVFGHGYLVPSGSSAFQGV